MSGHSKWSTIKRKKGAADAKRGKMFTRCIHEITTAVREGGGGDPDANPRLRTAVDKAKAINMPNENIDRAIKRATGEIKGEERLELVYEGYGAGGAAVLVEVLTDNKNRTVSEIRHAFSRCGGTLGENGCVAWMFGKKGVVTIPKELIEEDALIEAALEAGASDISGDDETWEVTSDPSVLGELRCALEKLVKIESAEVTYIPTSTIQLSGKEAEQMIRLVEMLEDLDDVLNVVVNCELSEEAA